MDSTDLYKKTLLSATLAKFWDFPMIHLLSLAIVSIFAFFPTFFNSFQLDWDDTWQVLENPLLNDASMPDISYHFTHFWQMQYSPVNSFFYMVIDHYFGLDASAFHAFCLLIHWVSSILVFYFVRTLVQAKLFQAKNPKITVYAFFTALIFAIHPLQVESVAWVSASKVLLYGFFTLVALFSYLKYIQTSQWTWILVTFLAYLLGFGSKEQAIILPLNLILFDYVFERYLDFSWKKIFSSRVILEKTPFFLMALGFWYFSSINNLGAINSEGHPLYQRLVFGFYSISEYIFRFLAPVKMYFLHPFPISPGESLPLYYYAYILLVGIIVYFVWDNYRKENKLIVFGFLFFLINLILVLHIIPLPRTVITADRYMYLSIIGISIALICQIDKLLSSKNSKILIASCIAWFIFLGIHTNFRTAEWKDSETAKASVFEVIDSKHKAEETELFNIIENE